MANILKKGVLGLSILAVSIFILLLYRAISDLRILSIREIEIKGNHHLSEDDLLDMTNIKRDNILKLSLENLRARILRSPWVKEAMVRRQLPGTIKIDLSERAPQAMIDYGDSFYLVDGEGVVIERKRDREGRLLPVLSGVDLSECRLGEVCPSKGLLEGLALLRFLREKGLGNENIELVAKEPEELTLNLAGREIKVGSGDYQEKFSRLDEIERDLSRRGIVARTIDVRFRGKVIVVPMKDYKL